MSELERQPMPAEEQRDAGESQQAAGIIANLLQSGGPLSALKKIADKTVRRLVEKAREKLFQPEKQNKETDF